MKIGYPKGDNYKLVLASLQPCQRRFIECLSTCSDDDLLIHLQSFTQWVWEKSDIICWASVLNRFDDIFSHYFDITRAYLKGEYDLESTSYFKQVDLVKIAFRTSIMIVENSTSKSIYNSLDLLIHFLDDVNMDIVYLSTRLLCVYFSSRNRRNSVLTEIPFISSRLATFVSNPLPERDYNIVSTNSTKYTRLFDQRTESEFFVSFPLVLEYYLKCHQYWLSKDSLIKLDSYNKQDNSDKLIQIPLHDFLHVDLISQIDSNRNVNYNSNEKFNNLIKNFVDSTDESHMYFHILKTFKFLVHKYNIDESQYHILRYKLLKTFSFYFVFLQRLLINTRLSSLICMLLINTSTYTQFLNYNPCFLLELSWFIKYYENIDYSTMIISTELLSAMIYDGIQYKTLSNLLGFAMPNGIFIKVLKNYLHHQHESQPLPPVLKLKSRSRSVSPSPSPPTSQDLCRDDDYTTKNEKELCMMQSRGFVAEDYRDEYDWRVFVTDEQMRLQLVKDEERMRVLLHLLIVYYSIISYHGNCSALTNVNVLEALVRFIRCRNPIYTPVIIYVVQVLEALLDYNQTVSRVLRTDLHLYHVFISRLKYDMYKIETFVHFGNDLANSRSWPEGWLLPMTNDEPLLREYWLSFSESSARMFLFKTIIKDIYSVTRPYSGRTEVNDYDVFASTSPMVPVILTILKEPLKYGHGVYSSVITLILDTLGDDPISQDEMHKLGIVPAFLSSINEETLKSEECLSVVPTAVCDMFLHRSGQEYYKSMKYSFFFKLVEVVVKKEFVLFDRFGEVAASIGISLDTIVRHHDSAHSLVVKRLIKVIYDLLLEALTFPEFKPVSTDASSAETAEYLEQFKTNSKHLTLDTLSLLDVLKPGDFYADRIANLGKCLSTFLSYTQSVSYFNSCDGIKLLVQLCTVPCLPPMFIQIYSQHPLVLIIKYLTSQSPVPSIIHFHTITQEYLATFIKNGRVNATTTQNSDRLSLNSHNGLDDHSQLTKNQFKPKLESPPSQTSHPHMLQDCDFKRFHGTLQFLNMMHKDNATLYQNGCCGKHQLGVEFKGLSTCDLHLTTTLALDVLSSEFHQMFLKLSSFGMYNSSLSLSNVHITHEHPQLRAFREYMADKKNLQNDVVFSSNDLFWSTQCAYAYSCIDTASTESTIPPNSRFEDRDLMVVEMYRSSLLAARSLIFSLNQSINKAVSLTNNGNECLKYHVVKNAHQIVSLCINLLKSVDSVTNSQFASSQAHNFLDSAHPPPKTATDYFTNIKYISDVLELVYRLVIDDRTNGLYLYTTCLFASGGGMTLVTSSFDYFFTLFFAVVCTMAVKLNPEIAWNDLLGPKVDVTTFQNIEVFVADLSNFEFDVLKSMYNSLVNSLQICLSFFSKCTNPRTILNTPIDTNLVKLLNLNTNHDHEDPSGSSFNLSFEALMSRESEKRDVGNLFNKMIATFVTSCWKWFFFMVSIEPIAPAASTASPFFYMPNKLSTLLIKVHIYVLDYLSPSRQQALNLHFLNFGSTTVASDPNEPHGTPGATAPLNTRRARRRVRVPNGSDSEGDSRDLESTNLDTVRSYLSEMGFNERDINNAISHCGTADITTLTDWLVNIGDFAPENMDLSDYSQVSEDDGLNQQALDHLKRSHLFHLCNIEPSERSDSMGSDADGIDYSSFTNLLYQNSQPNFDSTADTQSSYTFDEVDCNVLMDEISLELKSQIIGFIIKLATSMPTFLPTAYDSIFKLHSFKLKFTLPSDSKSKTAGFVNGLFSGVDVLKNRYHSNLEFSVLNLFNYILVHVSATFKSLQSTPINVNNEHMLSLFCPVMFVDDAERQAALDQILERTISELSSKDVSNRPASSDSSNENDKTEEGIKAHNTSEPDKMDLDYNYKLAMDHEKLMALFYLISHLMAGKENFTQLAYKVRDENNRPLNILQLIVELVEFFLTLRLQCFRKGVLTMGSLKMKKKFGLPILLSEWCLSGESESWFVKKSTTTKFEYSTLKYGLYGHKSIPQIAAPPPFFKYALICVHELIKTSILDGILLHSPHMLKSQLQTRSERDADGHLKQDRDSPRFERSKDSPPKLSKDALRQYKEFELPDQLQERLLHGCMVILDVFPALDRDVSFSLLSILSTLTETYRNAERLTQYKSLTYKSNMDFLRLLLSMPRSALCLQVLRMVSTLLLRVVEDYSILRPSIKNKILMLLSQGPINFNTFIDRLHPFNRKCPMLLFQMIDSMCVIAVDENLYPSVEEPSPVNDSTQMTTPDRPASAHTPRLNQTHESINYELKDLSITLKNDKLVKEFVQAEALDLELCDTSQFKMDQRKVLQMIRGISEFVQISCNLHGLTDISKSEPKLHYPLCFTISNYFALLNVLNYNFPMPLEHLDILNPTKSQGELQLRAFPHKLERLDKHSMRSVVLFLTRNVFSMLCCLVYPKNMELNTQSTADKNGSPLQKSDSEVSTELEHMHKMIIDSLESYSSTLMVISSNSEEAASCVVEELSEILHYLSGLSYRDSGPYLIPMAVYTICNLLHNLLHLRYTKLVNISDVLLQLKKNLCLILARLDLFKTETRVVCGSITRVLVLLTNTTNTTYQKPPSDQDEEAAVVVELEDSVTEDSDHMDTEDDEEDIDIEFSEEGEYSEEGEFSEDGDQEGEEEMIIDVSSTDSNESSESENAMDDGSEDEANVDMVLPHEVEEDYQSNQYSPSVSSSSMEEIEEEEDDEGPRIRVAGEIDEVSRTENSQIIDTTTNISIPEENESDYLGSPSVPDEPTEQLDDAIVPLDDESTFSNQRSLSRSSSGNHTIHIEIQFANDQNSGSNSGPSSNVRVPTTISSVSYPSTTSNGTRFYNIAPTNNRPLPNGTARNVNGYRAQQESLPSNEMRSGNDTWTSSGDLDLFSKNPLLPQFKKPFTVEMPDPLIHVLLKKMKVYKVKYEDLDNQNLQDKDDPNQNDLIVEATDDLDHPSVSSTHAIRESNRIEDLDIGGPVGFEVSTSLDEHLIALATDQVAEMVSSIEALNNSESVRVIAEDVTDSEAVDGSANESNALSTQPPQQLHGASDSSSDMMDVDSQGRYYNRGLDIISNALGITYAELFNLANMDPSVIAELPTEMREEIISQQLNTINVDAVSSLRNSRPRATNNFEGLVPSRTDLQYLEALPRSLRLDVTRAIYGENSAEANEINASIDLQGDNTSLIAALGPFFRGENFNSVNEFLNNITTSLEALERQTNLNTDHSSQNHSLDGMRPRIQSQFSSLNLGTNSLRLASGANVNNSNNSSRPMILPLLNNMTRNDPVRNDLERVYPRSQFNRNDAIQQLNDPGNGLTLGFIIGEIRGQNGMNRRINGRNRISRRIPNNLNRRNDLMRDVFLLSGRNLRMSRLNESVNQISLAGSMNDFSVVSPDNLDTDDRNSNFDSRILQSIPQILNTFDPTLMDLFPNRSTTPEPQDPVEMGSDNVMDEIVQLIPTSPCNPNLFRRPPPLGFQKEKKETLNGPNGSFNETDQVPEDNSATSDSQLLDGSEVTYTLLANGCGGEVDLNGLVGVCKMFFLPNEINKRVFFKLLYNISIGPSQADLMKMFLYMLKESILNVDVEYECVDVDETFFKKCPKIVNLRNFNVFSNLFTLKNSHNAVNKPKMSLDQPDKPQTLTNSIRQVFDTYTKLEYENFSYMCSERVLEQLRSLFIALPLTVSSFSKTLSYMDDPAAQELKRKKKRTEASSSFYPIDFFFCATATNLFQSSVKHMNHLLMVIHNLLVDNLEAQKFDEYNLESYIPDPYNSVTHKPESNMNGLDKDIVGNLAKPSKVDSDVHMEIINSLSSNALLVFLKIFTSFKCQSTWLQFCNAKDANAQAQMEIISQFMGALYKSNHGHLITSFMNQKFTQVTHLISDCLRKITTAERESDSTHLDYQMEPLMYTLLRMTHLMSETVKQVYVTNTESDQIDYENNQYLEVLHHFYTGLSLDYLWYGLDDCLVYLTEKSLVKNFVGDFYKELHIEDPQTFDLVRSLIPLIEVFLTISQMLMAYEYNVPDLRFDKILSHINYDNSVSSDKPDSANSSEKGTDVFSNTQGSVSSAGEASTHISIASVADQVNNPPFATDVSMANSTPKSTLSMESGRSGRDDDDDEAIDISPSHMVVLNFVEKHKKLLNLFIKQSPSMLNNTFLPLIRVAPMCLSFDVKRQYFRQKLREGRLGLRIDPIKINVRRQHVFLDSYHQLRLKTSDEMKGKLTVSFGGEEGVDAGGLTREWYTILSKEIFNPNYALFTREGRKQEFNHPNPLSAINPDHLNYFRFIGRVIGKALYDGHHMEAYFCRSFYKHMLGTRITPCDAESVDPQFYNNLISIRNSTLEQLGLELYFSTEIDEFGKVKVIDLIPNGRNILVTDENKHRYIQLLCKHKVTNGIRDQLDAFMEGFRELIAPELISIFDDRELELLISGIPIIDLRNMRQNVEYVNYSESSDQIKWLWEILGEFDQSHLAAFLQFVTGTSRVPIGGFKNLMGMRGPQKISIHKTFGEDRLPTAHTCFNQLDLPVYQTKEMLKSKLLQAILEGKEGFGFI